MAAILHREDGLALSRNTGLAVLIGESHNAVGIAHIERRADQGHAERLVLALQKHFADFRHAIAVRIAQ